MKDKEILDKKEWAMVRNLFTQLIDFSDDQIETELKHLCRKLDTDKPELIQATVLEMIGIDQSSDNFKLIPSLTAMDALLSQKKLSTGDFLGKYQIIKQIGSGGMGQVYLAERNDEVKKKLAIKIVDTRLIDDQAKQRFDTERRILASLEHPNIARLVDAGAEGVNAYYVMEYVKGIPIDEYCKKNQLQLVSRLKLFLQICEAVSYAHNNLIVHRDLKPSNILVTSDGEVKLLDFGIAKPLKLLPGTDKLHETMVGSVAMTPQYAAPEQIKGENITVSCDIYALGLLLYKLTTGQHAHQLEGKTWGEIERIINQEIPTLPSKVIQKTNSECSISWQHKLKGDLDAIISHTLMKHINERYISVRKLAEDVGRYLSNEPIYIKYNQKIYWVKKQIRKYWFPISAFTIFISVILISSILIFHQSKTIKYERDIAIEERNTSDETIDFLVDIFKYADQSKVPVMEMTANEVLQKGAVELDLKNYSYSTTRRLKTALGQAFWNLSDYKSALLLVDDINLNHEDVTDSEKIKVWLLQASLLSEKRNTSNIRQAIQKLKKASLLTRSDDPLLVEIYLKISENLYYNYEDLEYEKYFELAKKTLATNIGRESVEYAKFQYKITLLSYYNASNRKEELPNLISSLNFLESRLGRNNLDVASAYLDLATTYIYDIFDPIESEKYVTVAENIYEVLLSEKHAKFVEIKDIYARIYWQNGQYHDAINTFKQAMNYEQNQLLSSQVKLARGYYVIGKIYLDHLEKHQLSIDYSSKAAAIYLKEFNNLHPRYLLAKTNEVIAKLKLTEFYPNVNKELIELLETYETLPNASMPKGHLNKNLSFYYHKIKKLKDAIRTTK